VSPPAERASPARLADQLLAAVTPATKVLALTEVSNTVGLKLPVPALCGALRGRGVHVHGDGAQTFGAMRVDLHAMGCDSYAGSAHKWFVGPKEAGVLYVRADRVPGRDRTDGRGVVRVGGRVDAPELVEQPTGRRRPDVDRQVDGTGRHLAVAVVEQRVH
jgi:selenocysteine lyase/cysteine desulfurase